MPSPSIEARLDELSAEPEEDSPLDVPPDSADESVPSDDEPAVEEAVEPRRRNSYESKPCGGQRRAGSPRSCGPPMRLDQACSSVATETRDGIARERAARVSRFSARLAGAGARRAVAGAQKHADQA